MVMPKRAGWKRLPRRLTDKELEDIGGGHTLGRLPDDPHRLLGFIQRLSYEHQRLLQHIYYLEEGWTI